VSNLSHLPGYTAALALGLMACGPGAGVELEISEVIPTVATVRWTTPTATRAWVEFGPSRDYGLLTPPTAMGTEHEVVLLGLWEDETFHFRTVTAEGELGRDGRLKTGALPDHTPRLWARGDLDSWSGYQIVPFTTELEALAIVDPQGRPVWFFDPGTGLSVTRGVLAMDGDGVLLSQLATADRYDRPYTSILKVSWAGTEVEEISLPMLDHDFVQLPDGTLAGLCLVEQDGYSAIGDAIVTVDHDGALEEVWNGWQAFDPSKVGVDYLEEEHWTHANAMDYDPVDDTWLVGFRHLSSIIHIDRTSGEILWGLSGEVNDFTFTDGSEPTERQHQFQRVDGGIVVFDNGWPDRGYSRVVEYALDLDLMTADQVWEFRHEDEIHCGIKGDVSRFDDGSTQVVWSTAGEIQDIDPDGELRWQLNTDWGTAIAYSQRVDDLYKR